MNSIKRFNPRLLPIYLSLFLVACACVPKFQATTTVDNLLADPLLNGAQVSLTVRDAVSGAVLYQRNGDSRLVPGSSLKLLGSAAAMQVLGADYRFTTQVLSNGRLDGAVLRGNLYLRGAGDPSIQAEDYRQLAARLARQGVREVSGDMVFDDTAFDAVRLGIDWAVDDEDKAYGAQISALSLAPDGDFDAGSVLVHVNAVAPGEPVQVRIHPANRLLTVNNQATVGEANTIRVSREHGSNRLTVTGTVPVGEASKKWVSVWEPTRLVADVFQAALVAEGIKVRGRTFIGAVTAPGATVLVSHESAPLAQLMPVLLKLSNNAMTEVLLKAMGRRTAQAGTTDAGIGAVNGFFSGLGLDPTAWRQVDGSGLSRRNQLSTQSLTQVLLSVRQQPWFDAWYAALPIAGEPDRLVGGTLRNRLRDTPAQGNLHAKTGSLTGISSLSGYVRTAAGRPLVFAMVTNSYLAGAAAIRALEDRVVLALIQRPE